MKNFKSKLIFSSDKKPEKAEDARAYGLILRSWGQGWADKWVTEDVALVFVPFYWHRVYRGERPTGVWICGTSRTIGDYQCEL